MPPITSATMEMNSSLTDSTISTFYESLNSKVDGQSWGLCDMERLVEGCNLKDETNKTTGDDGEAHGPSLQKYCNFNDSRRRSLGTLTERSQATASTADESTLDGSAKDCHSQRSHQRQNYRQSTGNSISHVQTQDKKSANTQNHKGKSDRGRRSSGTFGRITRRIYRSASPRARIFFLDSGNPFEKARKSDSSKDSKREKSPKPRSSPLFQAKRRSSGRDKSSDHAAEKTTSPKVKSSKAQSKRPHAPKPPLSPGLLIHRRSKTDKKPQFSIADKQAMQLPEFITISPS